MDNTTQLRNMRYVILGVVGLLCFIVWFFVFNNSSRRDTTSQYIDSLSGETVNMQGVATGNGFNPNLPYFIGFNYLTKYGLSNDDRVYIEDVLTNYCLYSLNLRFAKISYVNKSFRNPGFRGTAAQYSFKVGFNDSNIHTVSVLSDIVNETINIKLTNPDNKKVFEKKFTVYSPN